MLTDWAPSPAGKKTAVSEGEGGSILGVPDRHAQLVSLEQLGAVEVSGQASPEEVNLQAEPVPFEELNQDKQAEPALSEELNQDKQAEPAPSEELNQDKQAEPAPSEKLNQDRQAEPAPSEDLNQDRQAEPAPSEELNQDKQAEPVLSEEPSQQAELDVDEEVKPVKPFVEGATDSGPNQTGQQVPESEVERQRHGNGDAPDIISSERDELWHHHLI